MKEWSFPLNGTFTISTTNDPAVIESLERVENEVVDGSLYVSTESESQRQCGDEIQWLERLWGMEG